MTGPVLSFSPRVRPTAFTERVEAAGVTAYTVYNHMRLPMAYGSTVDAYHHLKAKVQIWDVACQRQVEVRGPDAARLTQLVTPRELARATPGSCLYAPLVDETGAMINDPIILKLEDDRFWLSIADSDVLLWLRGLAWGLKLDVEVIEPDVSPLAIQGPLSFELAGRVFGESIRDLNFFRFAMFDFQGHPLLIARSGWSGQGGYEVYLDDSSLGPALWDSLFDAGADLDVRPGCPNAIERIETGLLSYGADMTRENNPFECGLDRYCQLDQPGTFMARDALKRIRERGPERRIVGLRLITDRLTGNTVKLPVRAAEREIGSVSSLTYSPDFGCGLALAMLEKGFTAPGERVEVEAEGRRWSAEVAELPFKHP